MVGQKAFLGTNSMGVLRSTNNGSTWERTNTGLLNTPHKQGTATANNLGAFNVRGTTLYGQTTHGVWKTDDKGETWTELTTPQEREGLFGFFASLGSDRITTSHLQTDNTNFVAVARNQGFSPTVLLRQSPEGGQTWIPIFGGQQSPNSSFYISVFTAQNPQTLYVGVVEFMNGSVTSGGTAIPTVFASANNFTSFTPGSDQFRLYRTTNGGASWEQISVPLRDRQGC